MKKGFFSYFFTYFLYVFFLMLCYNLYLTDAYDYYGFKNSMTSMSLAITIVILLSTFFVVYKQKVNTYSKFLVYILVMINFIPSIITYGFMPFDYNFLLLLLIYWGMMILSVNFLNHIHIKEESRKFKTNIFNVYAIVFIEIIVMLFITRYTGISLSFDTVYDLRDNYFSANVPILLAYLYAAFKVVNPLLFVYFLNKNKKIGCFMTFIVQIIAFLCDGSKSTLFSIVIAFFVVKYVKSKKIKNFLQNEKTKYYILFGLAVINIIGFIEFKLIKTTFLYNYFIRRTFFLPALLNHYYYDFFSCHPADFFKQSLLGKFGFTSVYSAKIQNIIGDVYFSAPSMLANNGLFSDAYMNLGITGMFVMPFAICLAFRFLDYCARGINPYYLITVLISVSYIFLSSSFFTVLMTHGYLLLCLIILVVLPKDKILTKKEL